MTLELVDPVDESWENVDGPHLAFSVVNYSGKVGHRISTRALRREKRLVRIGSNFSLLDSNDAIAKMYSEKDVFLIVWEVGNGT